MKKTIEAKTGLAAALDVARGRNVAVTMDDLMAGADPAGEPKPRRKRAFDAARTGGHDAYWTGVTGDANYDVQTSLDKLRAKCRDAYQNTGYGRTIIDTAVNAIVATGIKPTPMTGDKALDEKIWALWQEWGQQPASGMNLDIYGVQSLLVKHWLMDGEGLIRFRSRKPSDMPGLPPLKLQLLEPDLLPVTKTQTWGKNDARIICGVEFDAIGEITAYHLLREHPGASYAVFGMGSTLETTRVPADNIVHVMEAYRAGQVRGVPLLTPVLMTLWNLAGFQRAILIAARTVASIAAVVKGGAQNDTHPGINNVDDDVTGQSPLVDSDGNVVDQIFPGMVAMTPDGKDIVFNEAKMPSGIKEFIAALLHEAAAGVGMSYHTISGDMSDSSFAQAKLSLIKEKVALTVKRELILLPAMNKIYRRFISECQVVGLLPNRPGMYAVRWSSPRIPSADENTEVSTAILKMQAGLESRPAIMEAFGIDPDVETAAIAADNALLNDLGILSSGNLAAVTLAGQAQQPPAGTTTTETTD